MVEVGREDEGIGGKGKGEGMENGCTDIGLLFSGCRMACSWDGRCNSAVE